ncbi:hypothetical protein KCV03_g373, partial [Aureobasidium melanogenum]
MTKVERATKDRPLVFCLHKYFLLPSIYVCQDCLCSSHSRTTNASLGFTPTQILHLPTKAKKNSKSAKSRWRPLVFFSPLDGTVVVWCEYIASHREINAALAGIRRAGFLYAALTEDNGNNAVSIWTGD